MATCVLTALLLIFALASISGAKSILTMDNRIISPLLRNQQSTFSLKAHSSMSVVQSLRGGSTSHVATLPFGLRFGQLKFLLQVALTSFNIICWSLPLQNRLIKGNKRLLALANCFAGGIFLMLSFGHLIPESIAAMGTGGNQALLFVVMGFMAMLFVGKVAFQHADHDEQEDGQNSMKQSHVTVNSAMVLCLAMSVHSFFESAALGMANDLPSALLMSACIGLHQPAESLALVVAFLRTNMDKRSIVTWLSAFSVVGLVGNLLGTFIKSIASESTEAIIVAVTAGTFIYVGAAEIAGEEFEEADFRTRLLNFAVYALGMVCMLGITNVVSDWESRLSSR